MPSLAVLSALVLVSCMIAVNAECPNGCSGRGSCSSKDMCQCYKNYQGNDCSERTCGFGYAHTDTAKGDLDMASGITTTGGAIVGSQVYPYGTAEFYNPGAASNEAHFYMECSNQGLCGRESGDCVCFDGFEGSACQRASCPNSCSNHGSCESISEFATTAGGTLYTKGLSSGDTTYDLWDAKVSYGCKCDPWFTGADCSQRLCKVGVDPMYYDTDSLSYETVAIRLTNTGDVVKPFRLRFWDYWGESFITNTVTGAGASGTAALLETALEALPNGVIKDVSCVDLQDTTANSAFFEIDGAVTFTTANELLMLCQFKTNPGALRLPEVYSHGFTTVAITTTPVRGEDANLCDTLLATQAAVTADLKMTFTSDPAMSTTTYPKLAKIGDVYTVLTAKTSATEYALETSFVAATADVYISNTDLLAGVDVTASVLVGATTLPMVSGSTFAAGDKIICENQIFNVVSVSTNNVIIDRPFFGTAKTVAGSANDMTCYEIASATISAASTYVSECSGRGVCDRESGVCTCFKGYTNDNCDRQSILAF